MGRLGRDPARRPAAAGRLHAGLAAAAHGAQGPAFLAYQNFQVYLQWNHSLIYCITVAYLGTRLDGAPPVFRGNGPIPELSLDEVKDLQRLLAKRGYEVGEIDGKLGAATRGSIKAMQMKLGLPANSYPTAELLERLRGASGSTCHRCRTSALIPSVVRCPLHRDSGKAPMA